MSAANVVISGWMQLLEQIFTFIIIIIFVGNEKRPDKLSIIYIWSKKQKSTNHLLSLLINDKVINAYFTSKTR